MGFFKRLFGRKKHEDIPVEDKSINNSEVTDTHRTIIELNEEEINLLNSLGIDEVTGLQLKTQTRHTLQGLFIQFLEDGEKEPELRGIRSYYEGKEVVIAKMNRQKQASYLHFFECSGDVSKKRGYIAVVKTTDHYDILRIMETNGANYEVFTEDIIAFLKRWETRIPFMITRCEADSLMIDFDVNNPHLFEMVNEAIVLCPDLTAGGDTQEDYDELISYIRKTGAMDFWWD